MSVQASGDRAADPNNLNLEHVQFNAILEQKSTYLLLRRSCEIFILILVVVCVAVVAGMGFHSRRHRDVSDDSEASAVAGAADAAPPGTPAPSTQGNRRARRRKVNA